MRIVVDMQGAQTGSRFRGIGRYTLSLAKALARNRCKHEIILALNGRFPDTLESIRLAFNELLPADNIRIWQTVGPTKADDPNNRWRHEASERIREAFLESLQPDVILISSLFEGFRDDTIGSIGTLFNNIPPAVVLYDLIPLLSHGDPFGGNEYHKDWYHRQIAALRRSRKLLAISESARQEALSALNFDETRVTPILGASDPIFRKITLSGTDRNDLWKKLAIQRPFVLYTGGGDASKNLKRLVTA